MDEAPIHNVNPYLDGVPEIAKNRIGVLQEHPLSTP